MTEDALTALHAPIGLDIGADQPAEIAVSILAEIIGTRSGGSPPARRPRSASGTGRSIPSSRPAKRPAPAAEPVNRVVTTRATCQVVPMERRDDLRWPARAATAIAVVLIALSVSFLTWRAAAPSQCAQLYPAADQWTDAGVLPDVTVGCPLREGDLVTAAERQPTRRRRDRER